MTSAIGYIRWSSAKQNHNMSEETQKSLIEAAAKGKGFNIDRWIIDDATSAFSKEASSREGAMELLNVVLNGDFQAIFFYDDSRLDRKFDSFVNEIITPIRSLKPGVKFFSSSSSEEWNEYNPHTMYNLNQALTESAIKSARSKDVRKQLLYGQGEGNFPKRPGARIPFGYRYHHEEKEKYLVPDETEAPIVNLIFFLASWGINTESIADFLNDCSIPPPIKGATKWHSSSVDYILKNVWYIGKYADGARTSSSKSARKTEGSFNILTMGHEAIVSPTLWELVVQIRDLKKKFPKFDTPFVLRDLFFCEKCQEALIPKNNTPSGSKKKYLYYHCETCTNIIEAEKIHKEILSRFRSNWDTQLKKSTKFTVIALNKWKKELSEEKLKTMDQLNQIKHKQQLLLPDQEWYLEWKATLDSSQIFLEEKVRKITLQIERISHLESDSRINDLFTEFVKSSDKGLSQTELRTLVLLFIKNVSIDFTQNKLKVTFNQMPFDEMKNSTVEITENIL